MGWMRKSTGDTDALQKWLQCHMEDYAGESMRGSLSMPNAPLKDSRVPFRLNRLLVRIDYNLRSGARHQWLVHRTSLTQTFILGLRDQGFMQAECRGSSDPGNVEGKTWHAMMAIVQTRKRAQGRKLLLLQLPRLVKHHREGPLGRGGPVRRCAIEPRAGG